MVSKSEQVDQFSEEYIGIVRDALGALSRSPDKVAVRDGVRYQELQLSDESGQTMQIPVDGDVPFDNTVSSYVVKLMEYTQTFLVSERLAKEMRLGRVIPLSFDPTEFIEVILAIVGRGTSDARLTDELRYFPMPHLQVNFGEPFVDFAGFLAVTLMDYLGWKGETGSELERGAKAEVLTAIDFLTSPETFIEDDDGVGWAFIPGCKCDTRRNVLAEQRHAFPTAWAIVAIQKYLGLQASDLQLTERCEQILPKVLKWIETQRRHEGLFGTSRRSAAEDMVNHNFITEALLALTDLKIEGAKELASEALTRFLNELERTEEARLAFEEIIQYPIRIEGKQQIAYTDHTTWATLLSTLAYGVNFLQKLSSENAEEELVRARTICAEMVRHIALQRKNDAGLWQRGYLQFHWVLTAVEGLMRYARFAQPEKFDTSMDAVVQAINVALKSDSVVEALQKEMVEALRTMSAVYRLTEDKSSVAGEKS